VVLIEGMAGGFSGKTSVAKVVRGFRAVAGLAMALGWAAVLGAPPSVEDARKSLWSVQPVKDPAIPHVKDTAWVRGPIDAFILAKLEEKGLKPAPEATRVALIRRATYDLIGLPPSPAEVKAFLDDRSPDAYERLINRLLASPHYGEKWGRHWLDLVRYGESNSYERDSAKPNVWRYRDYVIRSFNEDKPYDQFVKEQLAGDEMPDASTNPDRLIATGFYRLGAWDDDASDKLQGRYDTLDDIVTTTGQVFLGLTVDCARCHNHKIDPIPQTDYYRLLAFFQNIRDYRNGGPGDEVPIISGTEQRLAYEKRNAERTKRQKEIAELLKEMDIDLRQILQGEKGKSQADLSPVELSKLMRSEGQRILGAERYARYQELKAEQTRLAKGDPNSEFALCVTENGPRAPQTYVCLRGNANARGDAVHPGFPELLGGTSDAVIPEPAQSAKTSGRRTVLANWITSRDNVLFSRVMVNRIWQYHFGRGIVRTPNNFGIQGDKPTHPELLDWLATEFERQGFRLKAIHRLIVTSSAYRMSDQANEKAMEADPQDDLLWRFDIRRLTAEEIRDSILAVNGTLNPKMFGPSVYPHIPAAVLAGQSRPGNGWTESNATESARRSIYVHVKRSLHLPLLENFDSAESDRTCPVRFVTVQPSQALHLMNGSFAQEEAAKLADRLHREAGDDPAAQIKLAWRLVTCREPTDTEISKSLHLIQSLQNNDGALPKAAMNNFCLMMLNLNEFVYVN
jgi:hypothetical protein